MADITGYSQLGLVGFTDKGDYVAENTYMMNDLVHYQNSIWKCKADQTSGVTPDENNNWTIFTNGTKDLNAIIAADVQGLLGEEGAKGVNAQLLINAIAEKVATKVLMKTDMVTQIVNDATKAASMAALYAVNAKIGDVENLPNSAADVVAAIVQQNSNSSDNITTDYFNFSIYQKGPVKCMYDRGYTLQTKKAMSANTTYQLYTIPNVDMRPIIKFDKYIVLRPGIFAILTIDTDGKIAIIPTSDVPESTYIRFCELYL